MATKKNSHGPPSGAMRSLVLQRQRSSDNFAERIQRKEAAVLQIASDVHKKFGDHSFDSNWEIIAWGIDVIQQMLDTPLEKRGKMAAKKGGGITPRFQLSLNGLVESMQQSSRGPQLLLQKLKVVFDDYLKKVVQPAIQSKEGTEKLKEFVFRWENHKIFCEYIRRLFMGIDKGSCQSVSGGKMTVSSMGVRKFKETLWEIGKKDIVGTMLALIRDHRNSGKINEDTKNFLHQCKEILCIMGVVDVKHFDKIHSFVDPAKANKGRFRVLERLKLIESMHQQQAATLDFAGSDDRETYIEVGNHITFYKDEFQSPLLKESTAYFQSKRDEFLSSKNVPKYFEAVDKKIEAEQTRVKDYLHKSTLDPMIEACIKCMVAEPTQSRLLRDKDSGFMKLLQKGEKPHESEDLERIFRIVGLVDKYKLKGGHEALAQIFKEYVIQEGDILIEERKKRIERKRQKKKLKIYDPQHDPAYIDKILALYRRCNLLFVNVFKRSATFRNRMAEGFEKILNHNWGDGRHQTESFVANYLDMLLQGKYLGKKSVADETILKVCQEVLDIFKFLKSRDSFIESSKRLMALRLLNPKFNKYTRETEILSRLKAELGGQNIGELQFMLTERGKQKEVQTDWESSKWCITSDGKSFVPQTCRESAWAMPENKLNMKEAPKQVKKWMQAFEEQYGAKYDSRQLMYRHDLSFVELEYKCGDKTYRIEMNAPQAAVLLMFTSNDKVLQVKDIQSALQIMNGEYVKALLLTMLRHPTKDAKSGIIEQILEEGEKASKNFKSTAKFRLSTSFKTKYIKFDLPKLDLGGAAAPKKPQRNWRLEAALVRIMKAEKVLPERDLIDKAMEVCKKMFVPEIKDVKRCIENLIKKGYMERTKEDKKVIKYCS